MPWCYWEWGKDWERMSTQCIPNTLGHILSSSVNACTQNNLGAHLFFDPYFLQSLIQEQMHKWNHSEQQASFVSSLISKITYGTRKWWIKPCDPCREFFLKEEAETEAELTDFSGYKEHQSPSGLKNSQLEICSCMAFFPINYLFLFFFF